MTESLVQVDVKAFHSALQRYLKASGKTIEEELPRRMRRLLFAAYQKTPLANTGQIKEVIENPKFISWYISEKVGAGHGARPGNPMWSYQDWNKASPGKGHEEYGNNGDPRIKNLASRKSARYYGKAGFIKAIRRLESLFPATATGKSLNETARMSRMPHDVAVKTVVKEILEMLAVTIDWKAEDTQDANGKERIYKAAVSEAFVREMRDMEKYISRKLKESANALP